MADVLEYYETDTTGGLGNAPVIFDALLDKFVLSGDGGAANAIESSVPPEIETFALSPVTSSSGLKGVLINVIGPYDNVVTQYRYLANSSSNYSYVNEITPDYPWICSALLFVVLLVCTFRMFLRVLK